MQSLTSATDITPNPEGSHKVTSAIWTNSGLRPAALDNLDLTGITQTLPSSFHVGVAAQASIALAALAAAETGRQRGMNTGRVGVDMQAAERECSGYFTLDGQMPPSWAPLSGLYPCRDGHVRIHANFDHHRDAALAVLGLTGNTNAYTKADVTQALRRWDAVDFESAVSAAQGVASASRTFEEWHQHAQAGVISDLPLLSFEQIGDAAPLPIPLPSTKSRNKPLAGIRVLDLTRILAGPVAGRTLAAYGADVMLVNSPRLPNIEHIVDTSRGKLSTLLDLHNAADAGQLASLVRAAHVFIQGYHPGGLARLGFDPANLARSRPGIVYVSLSAYGHLGPWAQRRGFDSLVQTATGFNQAEADAAGAATPQAMPVQILDYASGFLLAFAAQVALLRQAQVGGSWHVRVSLAQTAHWLRGLGRVDRPFARPRTQPAASLRHYPSGFGELMAIPHSATFGGVSPDWQRPAMPPGSHPPAWPEAIDP